MKSCRLIDELPVLPRNILSRQNSSYHRSGINKDAGNFLYVDEHGEAVLFDAYGPGCIKSIFATSIINGTTIRFYFDGEEKPRFDMPIMDFFSGGHPQFPAPMVSCRTLGYFIGKDSLGGNCIMPIPFGESLKITVTGNTDIFYHIHWEQYPMGHDETNDGACKLPGYLDIWSQPEAINAGSLEKVNARHLVPGKKEKFFKDDGAACIRSITIESGCVESLLKDVFICMRWDDDLYDSVHAPLGHFFAVPAGPVKMNTPLVTVEQPDEFTVRFICRWPMPYWKNAAISLLNLGNITIPNIRVLVETVSQTYTAGACGYFTAHYHSGATEYGRDWSLMQAKGWGKYVGTVQMMQGEHYCEGDEHFTLDDACTPQINGTGTEDYYLFCFWPNPLFNSPYNGSTTDVYLRGGGLYDNSYLHPSAYYRFHLESPIAFYSGISAKIQHGAMSHIHSRYSSLTFCYLRRTPVLVLSDCFDVANVEARRMHGYSAAGGRETAVESSFIGNDVNIRCRLSGFEHNAGEIQFQMASDAENEGVMLRRRIDQANGRQKAEVWVDGEYAGIWYDANTNETHRWHDSDFLVPPALCKGKSLLRIKLKISSLEGGRFTEYGYRSYSFVRPASRLPDERKTILGEYADQFE